MKQTTSVGVLLASAACVMSASGVSVMTFEGLGDQESIQNFYNGGFGGGGSGPGPNFGVVWSPNALSIIDSDAGGTGNFANEPTGDTIMFFLSGGATTMNVAAGFTTGFSFFYTSVNNTGFVTVWDGLNGTGNMLAMINLAALGSAGNGDPFGTFDTWAAIGVAFGGTALSVDFGGSANFIGFDNITLGDQNPGGGMVPLPSAFGMGLASLGGLAGMRRRRR